MMLVDYTMENSGNHER